MDSRYYSSFLLRLWSVSRPSESESETGRENSSTSQTMVLQLQHLQTGQTWRLHSLAELNELLQEQISTESEAAEEQPTEQISSPAKRENRLNER